MAKKEGNKTQLIQQYYDTKAKYQAKDSDSKENQKT